MSPALLPTHRPCSPHPPRGPGLGVLRRGHLVGLTTAVATALGMGTWGSAAAALASHHTQAGAGATQVAYRCGAAPGKVQYSQWPCPQGQRLDHLADARTEAQQQDGARLIQRDQALAKAMAQDRHHLEKLAAEQTARSLGPHRQPLSPTGKRRQEGVLEKNHVHRCHAPNCFRAKVPKTPANAASAAPVASSASSRR